MSEAQQAYDRYQAGKTQADKQQLATAETVNQQFIDYVNNWSVPDLNSVEQDPAYTHASHHRKRNFYQNLCTSTLHVQWGNYEPKPTGSGNVLLVELRFNREENVFELRFVGFENDTVYRIPADHWVLNSNSIEVKGGDYSLNFKKYYGRRVNNTRLWNLELWHQDNLVSLYYLLPFQF